MDHEAWMAIAIAEAERVVEHDDVPIGAVLVGRDENGDEVELARAGNRREADHDPTAHAEILVLRDAARARGSWRLDGTTLYVTLEPCAMCAGAIYLSRIDRLVYGADDPKAGAVGSLWDIPRDPRLNHTVEVIRGVAADKAGALLTSFFQERRRGRTEP